MFEMDPKLKGKLDKEITKGKIPMDAADAEEPIDGDLDMLVARSAEEVWKTYDPKGTGFMDKKMVEKFFNVRARPQEPKGRKCCFTRRDMEAPSERNVEPPFWCICLWQNLWSCSSFCISPFSLL